MFSCSPLCFWDGEVRCLLYATRDRTHTKSDKALFISIHYFSAKCNIYQTQCTDEVNYALTKRKGATSKRACKTNYERRPDSVQASLFREMVLFYEQRLPL